MHDDNDQRQTAAPATTAPRTDTRGSRSGTSTGMTGHRHSDVTRERMREAALRRHSRERGLEPVQTHVTLHALPDLPADPYESLIFGPRA